MKIGWDVSPVYPDTKPGEMQIMQNLREKDHCLLVA